MLLQRKQSYEIINLVIWVCLHCTTALVGPSYLLYVSTREYATTYPHDTKIYIQVVGPSSLLYVSTREYATTYPHDTKISILGTDDFTSNIAILVRHTGSGAVGLTQVKFFIEQLYYARAKLVLCKG